MNSHYTCELFRKLLRIVTLRTTKRIQYSADSLLNKFHFLIENQLIVFSAVMYDCKRMNKISNISAYIMSKFHFNIYSKASNPQNPHNLYNAHITFITALIGGP